MFARSGGRQRALFDRPTIKASRRRCMWSKAWHCGSPLQKSIVEVNVGLQCHRTLLRSAERILCTLSLVQVSASLPCRPAPISLSLVGLLRSISTSRKEKMSPCTNIDLIRFSGSLVLDFFCFGFSESDSWMSSLVDGVGPTARIRACKQKVSQHSVYDPNLCAPTPLTAGHWILTEFSLGLCLAANRNRSPPEPSDRNVRSRCVLRLASGCATAWR